MADQTQSYANHVRWDPTFHFVMVPVSLLTAAFFVRDAIRSTTPRNLLFAFVAIVAVIAVFKLRLYALKVQDRLIRLEERLRLMQLLPADKHARIAELRPRQLVALRFAGDAEAGALAERCWNEKLEPKQIKEAIKEWRADFFRV